MDEWRAEHRGHVLHVDDCPFCAKRAAMDEEPVRVGTWCMIHSAFDCDRPSCYVCNNHSLDERDRCTAPTCRATNTPEVVALVADLREAPIELVRHTIGLYFARKLKEPGAVGDAGRGAPRVVSAPAAAPREGGYG